jgi:putative SOS response-associated peptidase YedK
MCGRYTLTAGADELVETFDVPALSFDLRPRYNVAPGQDCPIVAADRKGRRMGLMRWGFAPHGSASGKGGWINARAESVMRRDSFRGAFHRRRCLVPADGFYEWRREGELKVPYWFHRPGGGLFSFAGIWEGRTFAILTTDANDDVRTVHDRMPVLVAPDDRGAWLGRETAAAELTRILAPSPAGTFTAHEVSRRVNRTDQEDPGLVEPVRGDAVH